MYTVELEYEDIVFHIASLEKRIPGLERILESFKDDEELCELTERDLNQKKATLKRLYDAVNFR